MDNASSYSLVALDLTAALTAQAQTAVDDLDGIAAMTLVADFQYGSGGTTCAVIAQVSVDGGTVWYDVARFDFTTATRKAWCNLNGLLSKAATAYVALTSEGVNDGLLGPMIRGVVTSTGTYVNTTVSFIASVR